MTRLNATSESRSFVRGLITEASPLTFPDNASLVESNFNLNKDGSRQRRLGFDFEPDYTETTVSSVNFDSGNWDSYSTFKWVNSGGDSTKALTVVQIANEILFYDLDVQPLSDGLVDTFTMAPGTADNIFSFTVVDGLLVAAAGTKNIYIFEYDAASDSVTRTTDRLKIRDLFGVEDIFDGDDLTQTSNIEVRPTTLSDEHLYNLRNQTFAIPKYKSNVEEFYDTIKHFYEESDEIDPTPLNKSYPSNADNVTYALYPDANDSGNRTVERFFAEDVITNPPGSTRAPVGYFIIDALERGTSRIEEELKLRARYPELDYSVTSLPRDETPYGATVVAQYAGRVWFAGFSGEVTEGDSKSPKMSSYVLFSRTVQDKTDIAQCYQVGDPSSAEEPDLLDTDGGFIRIDGAFGIKAMVDLGRDLIVVAENGIWKVSGGDNNSFTANNYVVNKLSDIGCVNKYSIVRIDNDLSYWGPDAIYIVTTNDLGDRVIKNLTQSTIQTLYQNISDEDIRSSRGYFDSFERKIHWVYGVNPTVTGNSKELVFDLNLSAFYLYDIKSSGMDLPKVVDVFETKPFVVSPSQDDVVVLGDDVEADSDPVVVTVNTKIDVQKELSYLVLTSLTPVKFTFGYYNNSDFLDYYSYDDSGVDAEAEMITGYISGGDFQRIKDLPYLTTYMRQTETQLVENDEGNLEPYPQSSCNMQVQWEWSDSSTSGRWTEQREIYRLRRGYLQTSSSSDFDYGHNTVVTKNKIRGNGRVLSIRLTTSPGKDCHIYGWSMFFGMGRNV